MRYKEMKAGWPMSVRKFFVGSGVPKYRSPATLESTWAYRNLWSWAGLAVLVSWYIQKGSQDFLHTFSMALYHKWDVKNGFAYGPTYVLQFFTLISDCLGGATNPIGLSRFFFSPFQIRLRLILSMLYSCVTTIWLYWSNSHRNMSKYSEWKVVFLSYRKVTSTSHYH